MCLTVTVWLVGYLIRAFHITLFAECRYVQYNQPCKDTYMPRLKQSVDNTNSGYSLTKKLGYNTCVQCNNWKYRKVIKSIYVVSFFSVLDYRNVIISLFYRKLGRSRAAVEQQEMLVMF